MDIFLTKQARDVFSQGVLFHGYYISLSIAELLLLPRYLITGSL
jgi:hypothetical protein